MDLTRMTLSQFSDGLKILSTIFGCAVCLLAFIWKKHCSDEKEKFAEQKTQFANFFELIMSNFKDLKKDFADYQKDFKNDFSNYQKENDKKLDGILAKIRETEKSSGDAINRLENRLTKTEGNVDHLTRMYEAEHKRLDEMVGKK